jgi:hypothetical protein
VAIGDSITYLNDHANETGNRISKGYMTMVKEKLPNIQYINQGHNAGPRVALQIKIEELGLVKSRYLFDFSRNKRLVGRAGL